jgi:hypothetical protein
VSAVISSMTPPEVAERQRDTGAGPSPALLDRALEETVDNVLSGQCVRGFGRSLDIQGALSLCFDEDECMDMLARLLVVSHSVVLVDLQSDLKRDFEKKLRSKLIGSPLVQDVAERMMERDE